MHNSIVIVNKDLIPILYTHMSIHFYLKSKRGLLPLCSSTLKKKTKFWYMLYKRLAHLF